LETYVGLLLSIMLDMLLLVVGILVVVLLIGVSAFFSSSEMAFVSINRALVSEQAQKGNKKARVLEKLLGNPDNVISAIVIGNNLVNIFAAILAGWIATEAFGNVGVGFATVLMTFLVIVFSEGVPKSYGIGNEQLAYRVARPLAVITTVFHPLVVLLTGITNGLLRVVGRQRRRRMVTEREIMALMRLGEKEGTIERDEREMVNDVFEFDETRAYEIYIPKKKVAFIQQDEPIEALSKKSIDTGYSRFPVYRKNLDDIVGMVHVKDTLILKDITVPVKQIMRKILKVSSQMKADDVLRAMKRNKTHLALLRGPDGKTRGLISMEDLVEEIFGEITDEHDSEKPG
jgi:CBS domain containing-hemolysin-like protein